MREALAELRNEGLVRIFPHRGAFVFTLSAREVSELCEFRSALETAALEARGQPQSGCLRRRAWHRSSRIWLRHNVAEIDAPTWSSTRSTTRPFSTHCDNRYLLESYERNVGKIAALRTHLAIKPLHTKLSFQEHRQMLETIRKGDVATTLVVLDAHIGRTRETYSAEIEDIAAADKEMTRAS